MNIQNICDDLISEEEIQEWETQDELDDVDVEPKQIKKKISNEDIINRFSEFQIRVVRTSNDYPLSVVKTLFTQQDFMKLNPEYQRRYRWNNKKKSHLIESFLLNIPVPPIYLFENSYNSYEVMDGRQRLTAIMEFLEDKFRLIGMEYLSELNGKKFTTLPEVIQRGLLRRSITAIVLLSETSTSDDSQLDIRLSLFKRLNTGGVSLNSQEMRNAFFEGPFRDAINNLAALDIFRNVWGIPKGSTEMDEHRRKRNSIYRTMQDCELVLRFFAIRHVVRCGERGSLRRILDKTMYRMNNLHSDAIEQLKHIFINNLEKLIRIFGETAFHIPGSNNTLRPSRPLYDALMVAIDMLNEEDVRIDNHIAKERLKSCIDDQNKYDVLVGRGNTISAINDRVDLAIYILQGGDY